MDNWANCHENSSIIRIPIHNFIQVWLLLGHRQTKRRKGGKTVGHREGCTLKIINFYVTTLETPKILVDYSILFRHVGSTSGPGAIQHTTTSQILVFFSNIYIYIYKSHWWLFNDAFHDSVYEASSDIVISEQQIVKCMEWSRCSLTGRIKPKFETLSTAVGVHIYSSE
jgi:hypothetical protein